MNRSEDPPIGRSAQFTRGAALALIGISLLVAAHGAVVLRDQVGKTWTGFPVLKNGALGPIVVATPRLGRAFSEFSPQQRIVAIDGTAVTGGVAVQSIVEGRPPGTPIGYTVEDAAGQRRVVHVLTQRFTQADVMTMFLPLMVVGAFFLFVVSAPALVRPEIPMALPMLLWGFGFITQFNFNWPDTTFSYRFVPFQLVFQFLFSAGILHLGMVFPEPRWPFTAHPRLTLTAIYAVLGAFWCFFGYAFSSTPIRIFSVEHLSPVVMTACAAVLIVNSLISAFGSSDPTIRRLARYTLGSLAFFVLGGALLGLDAWRVITLVIPTAIYTLPSILLMGLMVYAVLTHNVFEFDAHVRRGLSLGILVAGVLGLYLGFFGLLQLSAADVPMEYNAAISAAVLLVLVPAVPRLSRVSDGLVERLLFAKYRATHRAINEVSRKLAYLHEPERVVALLRQTLVQSVTCETLNVVVARHGETLEEIASPARATALSLEPEDHLAAALAEGQTLSPDLKVGRTRTRRAALDRAAELRIAIAVPFPLGSQLLGGLLLGPRIDGRMYTRDDQMLLEMLAAQVSVALENARAWREVKLLSARLERENHSLRQELGSDLDAGEIVGQSVGMRTLIAELGRVARSDASVLVTGETGTGKELAVRALHRMSERADGPLVKVACAAIPETLLESELFGYEKGAFTGADERKLGRLEVADGGTVFFDEIDTLPAGVQAKLLRAIQEGEVQRLGSNETQNVDVRVVCATNRDLAQEVKEGRFREDLFYRLNVIPIQIPPLRERRDDIALLVQAFVEADAPAMGREVHEVSAEALESLVAHDWPGNVRELRNTVQRALVMGEQGPVLKLAGPLGADGPAPSSPARDSEALGSASLAELLRRYKSRLIREALEAAGGNQRLAAARLGLHRPSLTRMIRDLQIQNPEDEH